MKTSEKARAKASKTDLEMVNRWNASFGTNKPVRYWRTLSGRPPHGPAVDDITRTDAILADNGHPCIMLAGVAGWVSLRHVLPAIDDGTVGAGTPAWTRGQTFDDLPFHGPWRGGDSAGKGGTP